MQPKLKSKVRSADSDVGEVRRVIMDPLSHEVSHIVVGGDGVGVIERQVPIGQVQSVTEDLVTLRCTGAEYAALPAFKREDYVTTHEVEIAHLEERIHVTPGEVLVPFPELERSVKRRTFFANFTHAIGFLIGFPLAFPVLRYLMKPMYAPFDNGWLTIGNASKIKQEDVGVQYKYKRKVKEAYMPEQEIDKNIWVLKATPKVLESVYQGKDMEFRDADGKHVWTNKKDVPYVAYSGKCPHLGCGFKWRTHKTLGQVFLCPCHLSIYDAAGKVLDGPAPRALDPLPIKVTATGDIAIIDMEFKAGTKAQVRIV
ncbi:ubiquinol-cytochrome c reductase iron-sulfur subunit [Nitrospirales bacterium NOB]|nr:MAG: putative quinol-cytochrome c reductase iron-sulfur subunit modulated with PRC-barrel [Nitrospira sp. OLB3]MBV6471163.1 Cytochrome b6-f complex iron-sulfur subunit [Nitrospirota bacterium]MCE7966705.1 ubiquinol-cytochrome c reductase iron-sulfur subunit [Nitrospira sp. NTP2]MCK6493967.1 ubiquinol-cytochrome c reductase iron-sulfur subunit [Nitrospira sp.]MDL1890855.1 ubiquinol-cytochrome c reductase iron-sulfur subunit [Nitrospirales bacterium NOB]MEB2338666.1 ubiquinol-cytochrome c red